MPTFSRRLNFSQVIFVQRFAFMYHSGMVDVMDSEEYTVPAIEEQRGNIGTVRAKEFLASPFLVVDDLGTGLLYHQKGLVAGKAHLRTQNFVAETTPIESVKEPPNRGLINVAILPIQSLNK